MYMCSCRFSGPLKSSSYPNYIMISNKTESQGTDRLIAPAITIRTDIRNQVGDQIHLAIELRDSVMESEIPPLPSTQSDLPYSNKLRTAPGYFRSRTALYTLGQHLPFSLCRLPPPPLFSLPKSSHQSHTSWVCIPGLWDNIVPLKMEMLP